MFDLSLSLTGELPGIALKLGAAAVAGAILGFERERKDKPAGLRTILLISVGAALYMIVSGLIPYVARATATAEGLTEADPGRIAAQVVSGIGFLGAGTIIQARGSVQGLTTAAVIWVSAALGLCAGLGFGLLAIGLSVGIVFLLVITEPLGTRLSHRAQQPPLTVLAPDDSLTLRRLMTTLHEGDIARETVDVRPTRAGEVQVTFTPALRGASLLRLLDALARIDGVRGLPTSADAADERE